MAINMGGSNFQLIVLYQ